MLYKANGFPKIVSEHIELPDIVELLKMPMCLHMPVEDLYKNGTEFQRYVIDKTPFTNKKKYILCQWAVTYLTPEFSPVLRQFADDKEWHVDGYRTTVEQPGHNVYHLMTNETSSMTEFNAAEFELTVADLPELSRRCNEEDKVKSLLIPQEIEPNRIYTFDNLNLHRGRKPSKPELRFMYRVAESDETWSNSIKGQSFVYDTKNGWMPNFIQEDGKIKMQIFGHWKSMTPEEVVRWLT